MLTSQDKEEIIAFVQNDHRSLEEIFIALKKDFQRLSPYLRENEEEANKATRRFISAFMIAVDKSDNGT